MKLHGFFPLQQPALFFTFLVSAVSTLEEFSFTVESDVPRNTGVVNIGSIFPNGQNFSVTWLVFESRTVDVPRPSAALSFDPVTQTLRSQENLKSYLGGMFDIRMTAVSNETGIQTAEQLRVLVVDKTYRLKLVINQNPQAVENLRLDIVRQFSQAVNVKSRSIVFANEKSRYTLLPNGMLNSNQAELCFYVLQSEGYAFSSRSYVMLTKDILPHMQRNQTELLDQFYTKYQIDRITTCDTDHVPFKLDGLAIGLLVLAIALAIILVAAVIFVCCWLRMKKLHAAVASTATAHPVSPHLVSVNEFYAPKPPLYQDNRVPLPPWQLPTYPFGMYELPPKLPPPSSCDANYEWQESTLDVADIESINRGGSIGSLTSSSAPSLTEDTVPSQRTKSLSRDRKNAFQNTLL